MSNVHILDTTPACSLDPCATGSECVEDDNAPEGFFCACQPGWRGRYCDEGTCTTVLCRLLVYR